MTHTAVLMYHEIDHGAPLCDPSAGYARFVVTEEVFARHMDVIAADGMRGVSLSAVLDDRASESPRVVLTFDDGCGTDRMAALDLLVPRGMGATFYVLAGRIGTPGYLSHADVRAIADAPGCEIASHGWSHRFLSGLSDAELRRELHDSHELLSELSGREVRHLSCPGGRWSAEVARVARAVGYTSCTTSVVGLMTPQTDPFQIPRLAVRTADSGEQVAEWCRGRGLALPMAVDTVRRTARGLVGDETYARVFRRFFR